MTTRSLMTGLSSSESESSDEDEFGEDASNVKRVRRAESLDLPDFSSPGAVARARAYYSGLRSWPEASVGVAGADELFLHAVHLEGAGAEGAQTALQEQFHKNLTLLEAETMAISILKQVSRAQRKRHSFFDPPPALRPSLLPPRRPAPRGRLAISHRRPRVYLR